MTDTTTPPPAHHAENEWALERHVYEPHVVGLPPIAAVAGMPPRTPA